jgi:hypothetical protein
VSQSFTVEDADKPFADKLPRAIDTVHAVAGLANLRIERKPLPEDWQGQFDPYSRTVTVSPHAPFPLQKSGMG